MPPEHGAQLSERSPEVRTLAGVSQRDPVQAGACKVFGSSAPSHSWTVPLIEHMFERVDTNPPPVAWGWAERG
jgi:hypothetical protein